MICDAWIEKNVYIFYYLASATPRHRKMKWELRGWAGGVCVGGCGGGESARLLIPVVWPKDFTVGVPPLPPQFTIKLVSCIGFLAAEQT